MGKLLASYAIFCIAISPSPVAEATGVSVHDNASQVPRPLPTQRLYACNRFSKSPLMAPNTNECKGGTVNIPDAVACANAAEACGYKFGGRYKFGVASEGFYAEKPTGCFLSRGPPPCRRCPPRSGSVYFNTADSGGPSMKASPLCLSACSTLASDWCVYRSDCRWTGSSCSDATCSSNRDCANGQSCDDGRCRSPTPSSKREAYAEMASNTNVCTSGTSRILDPATCTAAAGALGYRWESTSSSARRPQGCYYDVRKCKGCYPYVYFSISSVGTSSAVFAPLCLASPTEEPPKEAQPTEAPPTEAPPTEAPPTEAPPTEAPPAEESDPTEAPPTDAPPTEAPPTEAPAILPYTNMKCQTNDRYRRWRSGNSCTSEILNTDVTSWRKGKAVHFSSWAKIDLASRSVLSGAEIFYYTGQTCAFDVQYSSDGSTWATACTLTSTSSGRSKCSSGFPSSSVSYVRVHKNSRVPCRRSDKWFRLAGVKLYGTEAPPTDAPLTEAPPTEAPPTEAPPTDAPPTEAPPTEAPPTEAPPTDLLPYTGMTCETNDGYGRWRRSKACTAEVLNSDVTTWADGSGVHFSSWAKIALASPVVLSSVEVFHIRGQTCDYDVQYSIDGTVWATVCSVTAATSGTDACASDLPSAAVSYLRIHKPSQRKCSRRDAWFRLTGVKIFGASPTEAPTFAPTTTVAPTEAPTATTVAATVPPTISPTEAPTTTVAPEAPTTIPTTTKAPPATSRRRRRRGRKGPARRRRGRKGPARRRRRSKKGAASSKQ